MRPNWDRVRPYLKKINKNKTQTYTPQKAKPGKMAYASKFSPRETEAGRSQQVQGQIGLYIKTWT